MKVRMLQSSVAARKARAVGEIVDLEQAEAKYLVRIERAEHFVDEMVPDEDETKKLRGRKPRESKGE